MTNKQLTNSQILIKECVAQSFRDSDEYDDEASFFEYFSSSQILKDYDLSDDEIENGIVGSSGDGGCDSIYIFLNKNLVLPDQIDSIIPSKESKVEMVIIQSKRETSFKESAIQKWKDVSNNLLSLSNSLSDFTTRYNDDVRESFGFFRDLYTKLLRSRVKLEFKYIYVSYAEELHQNVKQQAEELRGLVCKLFPNAKVNIEFVGAAELYDKYNTPAETIVNLPLAEVPIALGKNKNYVGLVSLKDYYRFIVSEDNILRRKFFEANVRDYQGRNNVNSSIRETLETGQSEDFWWLNNGITILTSEAMLVNNRELQLTNPEIVNGLQTSNEIYLYFKNNLNLLDSETRNVLVRIIVPDSEESRDNIIFATNNQTNIPKASLRVTDPIHLQIELYLKGRGLFYDRRKNYYKNQGKKPSEIIGVSFLGQCLITLFLKKPDYARARPSTILTDDDSYNKLYIENQDLDVFYRCAVLGKKVQKNLKRTIQYTSAEKSDILFYLLYGVVANSIKKNNITIADIKHLDIDSITDDVISEVKDKIYNIYKENGGNGRVAKSSEFVNKVDEVLELA
ncbi:abortive phage resistance protein [Eubacterium ventriosum]|uniref:Abortive phage resistance protein n=1 Tax=Eubacterium ventriosum TaxID=39496 RepID=A0A415LHG5_9FIRM|nr:AIPR family protein [Eubacterium ventriosum]RHL47972.1 abortive phage resistance protein [Eubacterium ventriosum]